MASLKAEIARGRTLSAALNYILGQVYIPASMASLKSHQWTDSICFLRS